MRYVPTGEFARTLPRESFRRVEIGDHIYQTLSKVVGLKGVGQVRILISYYNEEFSCNPTYFATDQIRWEATRIIEAYSKRWKIGTFFRNSKRNLGIEDYQLRDLRGIKRRWYLTFFAYSLLESGQFGICQKPRGEPPRLGELITQATRKVFSDLVKWIDVQLNRGLSQEDICRIAYGS